ncbi:4-hydroxy-tetrahydrodipicolinate synthase [Thermodesulfovibrio thiophilus]|uniref:4-hydroxy-tetrahydrodipicolinate synthase n=1 Tax=Thermodesulfovibrio thiophilus TaxID=340095 RepID=UPI0017B5D9A1|nr:4-hydroxy-tetrahydrodipicolinate synthase [Thermodesulfovibrio thiophilus]HHW19722.1 4-hydroxy-tetrahydrodipicolinate synthase [Thermodesulfovibrio thiophilus]
MFKGSMVAIVTPFKNGKLDEKAFEHLIEWHIKEGTHGIVPCGTTGEASTLDYEEHYKVIEIAVKVVNKRIPVIVGTGSNSTEEAIMITKKAEQLGADAALIVTPYYNKPTQEGLYRHFKTIASSTGLPIILYNVPGRTSVNLLPSTVARLAEIPQIMGIKEATGDMKQVSEIIRLCGDKITVLSGDDFTNLTLLALGGKGAISVTANICPGDMAELFNAWERGDIAKARQLHYKLEPINKVMFIETNPIPVKTALSMIGKIAEEFRLPLCEMSQSNKEKLAEVLRNAGLIK